MKTLNISSILMLTLLLGLPAYSRAGGLYLYELGTEDVGLAGAGAAARAQDASVMATNPAGLTLLSGEVLTLGVQGLYGDSHYQLNHAGQNPGNVIGWFPGASAFYSHSVNEDLKLGLGIYGNFGLKMDFGDWAGQRALRQSTLLGMTIQPTVAYQLDEHWSLGASVMANYGVFGLSRASLQGERQLEDTDWSHSMKLGVLYQFKPDSRIGLGYTSRTRYEFDGNALASINGGVPLRGQIIAPQQLMLSAYHQLNSRWAVLGNLGWQDWSAYNDNQLFLGQAEAPLTGKMQDTWHAALGVQYQLSEKLRLNTGLAFDSSFYRDQSNTSLTMPGGKTIRVGVGAQYALNPSTSFGAAFEYAHIADSQVPGAMLGGAYPSSSLYFFTLNMNKRF